MNMIFFFCVRFKVFKIILYPKKKMFSSYFSGANEIPSVQVGVSNTIEIKTAPPKTVVNPDAHFGFYADLWRSQCQLQTISTFVQLHLPDIIGNLCLTIDDICENASCQNKKAMSTLCKSMLEMGLLYYEDNRYGLTEKGALLQPSEPYDIGTLMESITSDKVFEAFSNLPATITTVSEDGSTEIEEELLSLHTNQIDMNIARELQYYMEKMNIVDFKGKIAYWGVEDTTETLKNINLESRCLMIDSVLNLDEPVDVLILHRVMNLYGTPEIIEKCKEAIVPSGKIVLIDAVQTPDRQYLDVYAHATQLPIRPTEQEWTEMWNSFNVQCTESENGVLCSIITLPIRV